MMNPLLLLALFGGGLYLVTRSQSQSNAAPPLAGQELLTNEALDARFEKHLAALAAASPAYDKEQAAMTRSSFKGDDDRDRAIAMAEFAASGEGAFGAAMSDAAKQAAKLLSLDYRDKFELLYGKGKLADAVIAATIALADKAVKDPAAWSVAGATKDIDDAMVKLIVDAPFIALVGAPITKPTGVYDADFSFKEPLGKGQVSVGTEYLLASQTVDDGGKKMLSYVAKVLATAPAAGKKLPGKYAITFAPASAV